MTVFLGKEYIEGEERKYKKSDVFLDNQERKFLYIESKINDPLVSVLKALIEQDMSAEETTRKRLVFFTNNLRQEAVVELLLNRTENTRLSLIKLGDIPFYSLNLKKEILQKLTSYESTINAFGDRKLLIEQFQGNGFLDDLGSDSSIVFSLGDEGIDESLTPKQIQALQLLYIEVFLELIKSSNDSFSLYYFLSPEFGDRKHIKKLQESEKIVSTYIDGSVSSDNGIKESATATLELMDKNVPGVRFSIGNFTSNCSHKSTSFYINLNG